MDDRHPPGRERAESYLAALVGASKAPGIQYVAVDATSVLFEHAGGWADIGRRVPMNAVTTMMAYSMSKTITAAAVLQFVEQGRLELDAPAVRYLESFPYGPGITVRQLVSHTSGLPNPIPLRWVHSAERHHAFDEKAALSTVLRDHPRLAFEPGTKYGYSNIGYWLLGMIVEQVSQQDFRSYVKQHILEPLGVAPVDLGYEITAAGAHANGYLEKYSLTNLAKRFLIDRALIGGYEGAWLRIRDHYPDGAAFGGLVGTARGFGAFLQDQVRPHSLLFGDRARDLFFAPQRTKRGESVPMTLGWHVGRVQGKPVLYKEGGGGGFHSMMRLHLEAGIATVVMTNATGFDVRACLDALDPLFFPAVEGR